MSGTHAHPLRLSSVDSGPLRWGILHHLHLSHAGASEILKSEEEGGSAENSSANDTELSEESGAVETKSQSQVRYIKHVTQATGEIYESMRGVAKD